MLDKLHITVATSPLASITSDGLNLTQDIELLKSAILYADNVSYYDLSSASFARLVNIDGLDEEEFFYEFPKHAKIEIWVSGVKLYRHLHEKKERSWIDNEVYISLGNILRDLAKDARTEIHERVEKTGLRGLHTALSSGVLDMPILETTDVEEMVQKFEDVVGNAVLSGETYPLFDDETARLMYWASRAGILNPGEIGTKRAQQIGLASDLLKRLPLFESCPVDQIIDIRKELEKPLIGFRSAIIKFSRDVSSAPWNSEFPLEAEQVLREHLEPSILEIEHACKSNKLLFSLIPRFFTKEMAASSVLGVMVAHSTQVPEILGVLAGAAVGMFEAVREWHEKKSEIENNQLYFYYIAGKRISS